MRMITMMCQVRPGPQPVVKLTARNIISILISRIIGIGISAHSYFCRREYPVCAALRCERLLQLAHLSGCCSKPCQTRGERRDDLESTDFPFSADPKSKQDPLQCDPPLWFQALHQRLALQDPPRAARLVSQYRTAIGVGSKKTSGRETRTDPVVPSPTLALETRTDPVVRPHPRTDPVVRPHPWRPRQTQAQREEMWLNGRTVFRDLRTDPAQTARYCSVQ